MHPVSSQSGLNRIRPAVVLSVSICLNVLLTGLEIRFLARPAALSATSSPRPLMMAQSPQTVRADPSAETRYVTNRFNWRQIESTNYDEYAANLRGIGCPEKTVRDIILADLDKYYRSRLKMLSLRQPFWAGGKQRRLIQAKQAGETAALEQQRKALTYRLLGIEWFDDQDNPFGGSRLEEQALSRFVFGPMPEDTFQSAVRLFEKYDSLKKEFQNRTRGITTDEDEAQMRRLGDTMMQELATILTPWQLDELKARATALNLFDNDVLSEAVELTPTEARQIALARSDVYGSFRLFDWPDNATDVERDVREQQFTNAVANLVGEQRFADFQRAQDGEFRRLFELSRANDLPKETAVAVYDMRKLAVEEVGRLRNDASMDDAARQQRFEEMQHEFQSAVSGSLGDKAYQEYLRNGGAWITNLTKL